MDIYIYMYIYIWIYIYIYMWIYIYMDIWKQVSFQAQSASLQILGFEALDEMGLQSCIAAVLHLQGLRSILATVKWLPTPSL